MKHFLLSIVTITFLCCTTSSTNGNNCGQVKKYLPLDSKIKRPDNCTKIIDSTFTCYIIDQDTTYSLSEITSWKFNSSGNLISKLTFNSKLDTSYYRLISYDKTGKIEKDYRTESHSAPWTQITYYDNGIPTKFERYDDYELFTRHRILHSELEDIYIFEFPQESVDTIKIQFDQCGRQIREIYSDGHENPSSTVFEKKYDSIGHLTEIQTYRLPKSNNSKTEKFIYNEKGFKSEYRIIDQNSSSRHENNVDTTVYTYELDKNGFWIEQFAYMNNKLKSKTLRAYLLE